MSTDLIFYVVSRRKWPKLIRDGLFMPDELKENDRIECISPEKVNDHLNEHYSGRKNMYLLVIDTTRLINRPKREGDSHIVEGAINIDAILDKIRLDSNKEGLFDVEIAHN